MLNQIEKILKRYEPRTADQTKLKELTERFMFMERRVAEMAKVESGSAQIPGVHARILNGGFNVSKLSQMDRAVFPTIRLHPASSVQAKSFEDLTTAERDALRPQRFTWPRSTVKVPPAKKTFKVSIGWSSDQILHALPEIFDANLAQDLADFANSQVHITWTHEDNGSTVYSNFDTEVEIFGRGDKKNMQKAMDTFPILNQIVSLGNMLSLLSDNEPLLCIQNTWYGEFVGKSWPFPEGFTWEQKLKRYGSSKEVLRAELEFRSDLFPYHMSQWKLTESGVKELVANAKQNKTSEHNALMKAQKEIAKYYNEHGRNQYWPSVLDDRGMLSMAKVKKNLEEEKEVAKIEAKHGVKRKLDLKEGEKKAECNICKRHISKYAWEKHIDSRKHMQKALKLS